MYQNERYIRLMERVLENYSYEHILKYFKDVQKNGLSEHGFARLTSDIGILIAHGRKQELLPVFLKMMDFCCENIPKVKAANDFVVKEIIFCIMALEEPECAAKGLVSEKDIWRWKNHLKTIVPQACYDIYAVTSQDKVYNWALFTAVSEYMRKVAGLGDTEEFIEIQLASQLQWMDENGMYRDPHEPMVYDLVPRGLFAVLLHFGYRGKYYQEIDNHLKKAGPLTLKMQSVTGEISFGGRSNQFLYNEALLAIVSEYEASRYAAMGDVKLAGTYKMAVKKALDNIERYLSDESVHHVKNHFSIESKYGCEDYAYFDKYMITTASFLYAAYLLCDGNISVVQPEGNQTYTFSTSKHFHKTFLAAGGYFLEFDTDADQHYDVSGLGRIHKENAPSEICLSVPCTPTPNYTIDVEGAVALSLCPGAIREEKLIFATGNDSVYKLKSESAVSEQAKVAFQISLPDGFKLHTDYSVAKDGVTIELSGEGVLVHQLPAFYFDGKTTTQITAEKNQLDIRYKGWCCRYTTNGKIVDSGKIGCNRNGHYKAFYAKGSAQLSIKVCIFNDKKV